MPNDITNNGEEKYSLRIRKGAKVKSLATLFKENKNFSSMLTTHAFQNYIKRVSVLVSISPTDSKKRKITSQNAFERSGFDKTIENLKSVLPFTLQQLKEMKGDYSIELENMQMSLCNSTKQDRPTPSKKRRIE